MREHGKKVFNRILTRLFKTYRHIKNFMERYLRRLIKEVRILIPLALLLILLVNIYGGRDLFTYLKERLIISKSIPDNRLAVAKELLQTNQIVDAEKIAPGVKEVQKAKGEPEEIKRKIIQWQKITNDWPNYRDAYLELAILNWKIYRTFDARKFVEKAREVDPNSEIVKQIQNWAN